MAGLLVSSLVLVFPGRLLGTAAEGGKGAAWATYAAAGGLKDFLFCLVVDSLGVGTWKQGGCCIPGASVSFKGQLEGELTCAWTNNGTHETSIGSKKDKERICTE